MKLVNLVIEEQEYNGHKFYVLVAITDDKDNPKKVIGTVKKNCIKCITLK